MKNMFTMVYGSERVEIRCDVSADEASNRLRSELRNFVRFNPFGTNKNEIVGSVIGKSVRITRSKMTLNSFTPVLVGRLEDEVGGCSLIGRFRVHRMVQVVSTVWYTFVLGFPIIAMTIAVQERMEIVETIMVVLICTAFCFFLMLCNYLILKLSERISTGDKDWIKAKVLAAIDRPS